MAFHLAAPYENTLSHFNMGTEDPRQLYTYGTKWGEVNRIAFGALLCGPFAVVLTMGRLSVTRVIASGVLGAAVGAFVNFITDSSADLIGIALSSRSPGFGSLMAMLAWCVLVPIGVGLTLVIAQGVTAQRIRRAQFAVKCAAVACFAVQMIGGMMAVQDTNGEVNLQSQVPVWRMVEIAVGLTFGVTILIADEWVRKGTIRLLHGRNEYVDWSLDHAINRIGSGEGSEIYVRGFSDVLADHAQIVVQGDQFILEAKGPVLLNNRQISRVPLNTQDVIAVGSAQLVFRIHGAASSAIQPTPITMVPSIADARVLQDAFGQQISLVPGRYGVGRDATNAICLYTDPQVAPAHAELVASPSDLVVTDLQSGTGTRVNGRKITAATQLRRGDVVEFGTTRFSCIR